MINAIKEFFKDRVLDRDAAKALLVTVGICVLAIGYMALAVTVLAFGPWLIGLILCLTPVVLSFFVLFFDKLFPKDPAEAERRRESREKRRKERRKHKELKKLELKIRRHARGLFWN